LKIIILTIYKQEYLRRDWFVDLDGDAFRSFIDALAAELAGFGVSLECRTNGDFTVTVNSYADMLNVLRITSPADGVTSRCVGHIIGKSQNLDLFEDLRRAVNRVAFAPETIPPDDHNRKVCHNCGCGC
jgi:hypothetical protein